MASQRVRRVRTCPACMRNNAAGARFCTHCGTALADGAVPSPAATAAASRAEKRIATILFADIVGSTRMIADLEPDAAWIRLRPYVRTMVSVAERHGGTVLRIEGDGVLVLFGAPRSLEGHAYAACRAALAIRDRVAGQGGGAVRLRIGIHTGQIVVGDLWEDASGRPDASGVAVHFARRLQESAGADEIIVSDRVARSVQRHARLEPRGPVRDAGASWVLLGQRPPADEGGDAVPLVDRVDERRLLFLLAERAVDEGRQAVSLVGNPGLGKSHLLRDVARTLRGRGWVTAVAGAEPLPSPTPLSFLAVLMRAIARTVPALAAEDAGAGPGTSADAEALDRLAREQSPVDSEQLREDPQALVERAAALLAERLRRCVASGPLLLGLDDLQWADDLSLRIVDEATARVADCPFLCVAAQRPDRPPPRLGAVTTLELGPLDPASSHELVETLVGSDPSLHRMRERIIEGGGGTPLYLTECVRDLAERGAFAGRPGAYMLAEPEIGVRVPATVQDTVVGRVDRLPDGVKEVLHAAAVLGPSFTARELAVMTGRSRPAVTRALDAGRLVGLLVERRSGRRRTLGFSHELVRDAVRNMLIDASRQALHRRAAECIERTGDTGRPSTMAALAEHWFQAGSYDSASRLYLDAGAAAMESADYPDAIPLLEAAGRACERLLAREAAAVPSPAKASETRAFEIRAFEIGMRLRHCLAALDRHDACGAVLDRIEPIADRLDDDRRRTQLLIVRTHALNMFGRMPDAVATIERGVAVAQRSGDADLIASARYHLGQSLELHAAYPRARSEIEAVLPHLGGPRRHARLSSVVTTSVLAFSTLSFVCAVTGDFPRANAARAEALAIAEETGRAIDLVFALWARAYCAVFSGDMIQAFDDTRRILADLGDRDIGHVRNQTLVVHGHAAFGLGRLDDAAAAVAAVAGRLGHRRRMNTWALLLAGALERAHGRLDAAVATLEQALADARHHGYRRYEGAARLELARTRRAAGSLAAAAAEAAAAIDIARAIGAQPDLAHAEAEAAAIARLGGEEGGAMAALARARDLYQGLGMAFWLPAVEAALRGALPA